MGDGNCLFRSLAYIVEVNIQTLIISHMLSNSHMVIGNGASGMPDHDTIEEYIQISEMDKDGT